MSISRKQRLNFGLFLWSEIVTFQPIEQREKETRQITCCTVDDCVVSVVDDADPDVCDDDDDDNDDVARRGGVEYSDVDVSKNSSSATRTIDRNGFIERTSDSQLDVLASVSSRMRRRATCAGSFSISLFRVRGRSNEHKTTGGEFNQQRNGERT